MPRSKRPKQAAPNPPSDDEEIDEECAFDSSDERQYGDLFNKDSSGESDESDESDVEDGGKTLLDLLDDEGGRTDVDSGDIEAARRNEGSRNDGVEVMGNNDDDSCSGEDSDSGSEDDDDSVSSSEEEEDDDSEDEDDLKSADGVENIIEKFVSETGKDKRALRAVRLANRQARLAAKGENTTSGYADAASSAKFKLSLGNVIDNLQGRAEIGEVVKRLDKMKSAVDVDEAPSHAQNQRSEREVGYENATKTISEWDPIVRENRKKAHLSFPLNAPAKWLDSTTDAIAENFKPTKEVENKGAPDLEAEVRHILKESGLEDGTGDQWRDYEEKRLLEVNEVDPEVVLERQRELSKMRALMFYGEQKAHRRNKIKSKMYRKLKKKREAKAEEKAMAELCKVDPNLTKQLTEKAALDRARERMSLRHKNTSKYIRGLLKAGGTNSEHTRSAIVEQLQLEEKLKKKMQSMREESDDSESESSDVNKNDYKTSDDLDLPKKGMFALKFMQRGIEKERQKILQESTEDGDQSHEKKAISRRVFASAVGENETKQVSKSETKFFSEGKKGATYESSSIVGTSQNKKSNPWIDGSSSNSVKHSSKGNSSSNHSVAVQLSLGKAIANENSKSSKETKAQQREQKTLIRRAFAGAGSLEKDFEQEKNEMEEEVAAKEARKVAAQTDKPGWGSWTGVGVQAKPKRALEPSTTQKSSKSRKTVPKNVIKNEKRNKKLEKYKVQSVPYPFTSYEQYEQSLRNPIGNDWNTMNTYNEGIKPAVMTRQGTIIQPLKK